MQQCTTSKTPFSLRGLLRVSHSSVLVSVAGGVPGILSAVAGLLAVCACDHCVRLSQQSQQHKTEHESAQHHNECVM